MNWAVILAILGTVGTFLSGATWLVIRQDVRDDKQDLYIRVICDHVGKNEVRGKLGLQEIECPPWPSLQESVLGQLWHRFGIEG